MSDTAIELTNIAPEIFRQRLLIEAHYGREVDEPAVRGYLLGLAAHLELRTYGAPVVYAPASGDGQDENAGFDAFVPLIDSGISAYFWTGPKFMSAVLVSCKGFEADAAIAYTRDALGLDGEVVTLRF